jgi:hypothetical protein
MPVTFHPVAPADSVCIRQMRWSSTAVGNEPLDVRNRVDWNSGSALDAANVVSGSHGAQILAPAVETSSRVRSFGNVAFCFCQRACGSEFKDPGELPAIEPSSVGCTYVHDDPRTLTEILSEHHVAAFGALAVANGIQKRRRTLVGGSARARRPSVRRQKSPQRVMGGVLAAAALATLENLAIDRHRLERGIATRAAHAASRVAGPEAAARSISKCAKCERNEAAD